MKAKLKNIGIVGFSPMATFNIKQLPSNNCVFAWPKSSRLLYDKYLCQTDCQYSYFQAQMRQDMVKEMKNDFEEDRKKLKQVKHNIAII